jgi:RNA polymerase sigma-54 factor
MTPQLQQAIKLLQLSRLELVETVQQALLENPLLEEKQNEEAQTEEVQEQPSEALQEIKIQEESLLKSAEWDDYLGQFSSSSRQASERELPEDVASFESMYAAKPTLESHLRWQLHLSGLSDEQKQIGEWLIGNLESSGYLGITVEELAQEHGVPEDEIENVLRELQRFDPVGIAARSLQECLLVQLEVLGSDDPLLVSLVKDHMVDIEQHNLSVLVRKFKVDREDILKAIEVIKGLDPRPGNSFSGGETHYISPDVYVYRYGDEFVILLNDEGLPDLQLNPVYIEEAENKKNIDREYWNEQMRQALWIMKSIQQRQKTLYRVMESIVRFQRSFFEHGITQLQPLVLKDVAEDIEVHESTVSRITSNKYASTPFGIFELKFFFNSGLGVDGGGQVASESVKAAIKTCIDAEDQAKPFSDKKLVELLNEKLHVNIARRTVAKYRESLGIPSSTKRKKSF